MRDIAEADMARVVVLTAEGMSVRDIAEETGFTKRAGYRAFRSRRGRRAFPSGPGMLELISQPNCPTVPPPGIGTAGQSVSEMDKGGTQAGTATVTARMKALEKLAFLRDR
jgi:hypothetical protein